MSQQEVSRLRVLEQVQQGLIKRTDAAQILQISTRQLRRIERRYEQDGCAGLVHALRGKPSNRRLDPSLVLEAQQIVAKHYPDFGPTLAAETLAERHGIVLSVESVRKLMRDAGLWRAKQKRVPPIHPMRARRPRRGELIQIDGSPHDWFEGRGPRCTLLVFIDDATSDLMTLRFVNAETTTDYLSTLREHILNHGLPMCLYSDRHSIFRSSHGENRQPTQFAQALSRLGIEGLQASSPQAKGRVERANQTLQDRLIKAMRLAGINDMEAANAWLPTYIAAHNQKFGVKPAEPEDAHVPYLDGEQALDLALAYREQRKLSKTLSCQYRSQVLQIVAPGHQRRLTGQYVEIIQHLDGTLQVFHNQEPLSFEAIDKRDYIKPVVDIKELNEVVQQVVTKRYRPSENHPWKREGRARFKQQSQSLSSSI